MIKALNKYPGRRDYLKIPITLAANAGAIEKGQILARIDASGEYVKVNTGANDGSETPVGVSPHAYPDSSDPQPALLQIEGDFIKGDLVGLTQQVATNWGTSRYWEVPGQDLIIIR